MLRTDVHGTIVLTSDGTSVGVELAPHIALVPTGAAVPPSEPEEAAAENALAPQGMNPSHRRFSLAAHGAVLFDLDGVLTTPSPAAPESAALLSAGGHALPECAERWGRPAGGGAAWPAALGTSPRGGGRLGGATATPPR